MVYTNGMSFFHTRSVMLLRLALGVTFFWFGILKLFNVSPMQEVIAKAFPVIGESQFLLFLFALVEILLGVAFLANRFVRIAASLMIIWLLIVTLAVLVTQGFEPRFPVLSLVGEDVLKNLVFIAAGLVLLSEGKNKAVEGGKKDIKK